MAIQITRILAIAFAVLLLAHASLSAGDRFTDNEDGTISDHELGLMWSKIDNQGNVTWQDAQRWVRFTFPTTILAQYDDWRLPTTEELASLYNDSKYYDGYESDCGAEVKIVRQFDLSCAWVWAAEEAPVTARLYDFRKGQTYMDRKAKKRGYRALAVRPLGPNKK
ncbi:DUF1566 domain-containing protein [Desulfovibrio ferrophilus]|uniref:Lcl C-terminal domain-containing protein n=1 Tax=Desulfovibrio ferrophilus TaxID=241368 RepID=A0A2Z6AY06_9BACT|nr:DUF1566 domain-containing protein [Desulfovibrio ferrophilus]BBD08144.1 uncharacterized protein DFE_1418 [Desulfovibrio ferrophilus]